MRVRTLVAGMTLALFTTVLGAPTALAAPDPPPPVQDGDDKNKNEDKKAVAPDQEAVAPLPGKPKPTISVSPGEVEPGQSFNAATNCGVDGAKATLSGPGGVSFNNMQGTVGQNAAPGDYAIKLTCENKSGIVEAEATLKVVAPAAVSPQQQKAAAPGQIALDVSPNERRPGQDFTINFTCPGTGSATLTAAPGDVSFDNDLMGGKVNGNASSGNVEIKLTCPAPGNGTATDTLKVLKDDNKDAYLDLDPNDGYREDKIEVEAYCPGTDEAKLNSPVLEDVTLKRDGDNILRGKARVEKDAKFGDSFAEALCKGGERPKDDFYVLEHRKADLDLDPAFGKRGDEIKVYVICDFTVGKLESDVLDDIEVKRDDDDAKWRYRGKTIVVSDARAGEHTVKIKCGDDYLEEDFFVIVDGDAKGGTQVTVYPKGAPQTGGGSVGGPSGALGLAGLTGFATLPARRTVRR